MGQWPIFRKGKGMIIPRKEIEDIAAGPEGYSRIKVEMNMCVSLLMGNTSPS